MFEATGRDTRIEERRDPKTSLCGFGQRALYSGILTITIRISFLLSLL